MDPKQLPIRLFADQIIEAVKNNTVTVVIGETGSGKTTQISQILEDAGYAEHGVIGVTQPRRVAAVTVARRVAFEKGVEVGEEVGYAVRFEERTSRRTRIKYLTDGTLLRECLEDPQLSRYSVLVLDEAHERSLNTDIMFGLLKELVARREKQLRVVVTSATLDGEKFSAYCDACPVFHVPGRCFPVDIIHSMDDHTNDYQQAVVDAAFDIHCNQPPGDILVFLTGQAEIDKAVRALNDAVRAAPPGSCGDLMVLPIYAALPPEMQARIFAPPPEGVRRCIVATNIAETSVTVDGVVYVVDSGVVKQKTYNPATGMDSLAVVPISRVQATQRAGRAGRTRAGKCFRLYTKKFYDREMPDTTAPEIQRTSLVAAVLYLKSLPLDIDVLGFDYLDPPGRDALEDALRQLYVLDAIDANGAITEVGKQMSLLPLDPSLSRALLASRDLGCLDEMMTVAAMLSAESLFVGNKGPEQLVNEAAGEQHGQQQQQRGRGQGPGRGRGGGGGLSPSGKRLLQELMKEGLGDHVLFLRMFQAWEQAGFSTDWCREVGADIRGMRTAKDVRQQLERIIGPDGSGLDVRKTDRQDGGSRTTSRQQQQQQQPEERHRDRDVGARRREHEDGGGARKRKRGDFSDSKAVDSLRMALTIGFANRLARRMQLHNGYRTVAGEKSSLAQLHPSCARVAVEDAEEGLLPEWVVYHELVATGRVFLSKVCPVDGQWVGVILPKLQGIDVRRLSGGKTGEHAIAAAAAAAEQQDDQAAQPGAAAATGERRNTDAAVEAAKARYLARKARRGK